LTRAARDGRRWLLLALAAGAVFAAGLYFGGRLRERPPAPPPSLTATERPPAESRPERQARPAPPPTSEAETPVPQHSPAAPLEPAPAGGQRPARVALVIDDLGRSLADLDTLADLGVPLTYAVLPFESMTPQVVVELRGRRAEILCHLPMAPANDRNPGPGALRIDMPPRALARSTRAALEAVPAAVGVSNHMGSELSSDAGAMRAILGVVGERGLFYFDSRTSAESAGYRTALELGIPAAERDVFLDADPSAAAVEREFQRLLDLARERGAAIGVGHPHSATLEALARLVPAARQRGYEFVPLSYLLDRPGELPE
jgi:hypothetical protein